jgi:hypothetical protein
MHTMMSDGVPLSVRLYFPLLLERINGASRSEKLGRGGTDGKLAKPLIVIQRVQIPPGVTAEKLIRANKTKT